MNAKPGRTYVQLVDGLAHWFFTAKELPEWNNEQAPAIDVTDLDPRPQLGDVYENGAFAKPLEPSVDQKVEIDQQRDTQRFATIAYNGHTFQADRETLFSLTFQVSDLAAGGRLEPDFCWWDIDNVRVPMNAGDVVALHHLVRDRNYQLMLAARLAKDALPAEATEVKI